LRVSDDSRRLDAPPEESPIPAEPSLSEARDIGSASRSCLVIMALSIAILLLVCVSWIARLIF
jgi:hypothetical protein